MQINGSLSLYAQSPALFVSFFDALGVRLACQFSSLNIGFECLSSRVLLFDVGLLFCTYFRIFGKSLLLHFSELVFPFDLADLLLSLSLAISFRLYSINSFRCFLSIFCLFILFLPNFSSTLLRLFDSKYFFQFPLDLLVYRFSPPFTSARNHSGILEMK